MKYIEITPTVYGSFKVTTVYRGKRYSAVTTNTQAVDRYKDNGPRTPKSRYATQTEASIVLHKFIKASNNLR